MENKASNRTMKISWAHFISHDAGQLDTLTDLLVMSAIVNGTLSRQEWDTLKAQGELLGSSRGSVEEATAARVALVRDRLNAFAEDTEQYNAFLDEVGEQFKDDALQVIRSMAATMALGGRVDTEQHAFYMNVAEALGVDQETASQLLRGMWGGQHDHAHKGPAGEATRPPRERHGRDRRWTASALVDRFTRPIGGGPAA